MTKSFFGMLVLGLLGFTSQGQAVTYCYSTSVKQSSGAYCGSVPTGATYAWCATSTSHDIYCPGDKSAVTGLTPTTANPPVDAFCRNSNDVALGATSSFNPHPCDLSVAKSTSICKPVPGNFMLQSWSSQSTLTVPLFDCDLNSASAPANLLRLKADGSLNIAAGGSAGATVVPPTGTANPNIQCYDASNGTLNSSNCPGITSAQAQTWCRYQPYIGSFTCGSSVKASSPSSTANPVEAFCQTNTTNPNIEPCDLRWAQNSGSCNRIYMYNVYSSSGSQPQVPGFVCSAISPSAFRLNTSGTENPVQTPPSDIQCYSSQTRGYSSAYCRNITLQQARNWCYMSTDYRGDHYFCSETVSSLSPASGPQVQAFCFQSGASNAVAEPCDSNWAKSACSQYTSNSMYQAPNKTITIPTYTCSSIPSGALSLASDGSASTLPVPPPPPAVLDARCFRDASYGYTASACPSGLTIEIARQNCFFTGMNTNYSGAKTESYYCGSDVGASSATSGPAIEAFCINQDGYSGQADYRTCPESWAKSMGCQLLYPASSSTVKTYASAKGASYSTGVSVYRCDELPKGTITANTPVTCSSYREMKNGVCVPKPMDDKVLWDFFSKYVYEVERPFYVWNWFNGGGGRDPIWQTQLSATSSAGMDHLESTTRRFYQVLCSTDPAKNPKDCDATPYVDRYGGTNNMYGSGLYTSIDPVATQSYGGYGTWVLMQMHIPKGFRLVDIAKDQSVAIPVEIQQYFSAQGCSVNWGNLFNSSVHNRTSNCSLTIRHLLKDVLKLDGVMYSYSSSSFPGCSQTLSESDATKALNYRGPFNSRAIVIADTKLFTPTDVRIFNGQTRDGRAERANIFNVFRASNSSYSSSSMGQWSDLSSADIDPNFSQNWMKSNLMSCMDTPPYKPVSGK